MLLEATHLNPERATESNGSAMETLEDSALDCNILSKRRSAYHGMAIHRRSDQLDADGRDREP